MFTFNNDFFMPKNAIQFDFKIFLKINEDSEAHSEPIINVKIIIEVNFKNISKSNI